MIYSTFLHTTLRNENMDRTDIVAVYVFCDDVLAALGLEDHPQAEMSTAEVLTFAIIASRFFNSNHQRTRFICLRDKLFGKILSPSRLNRRLHKIPLAVWYLVGKLLGLAFVEACPEQLFIVDSFPLGVSEMVRYKNRKILTGREYVSGGPKPCCGVRVHMLVTATGDPVNFLIAPASETDSTVFWRMELEIPPFSTILADGAYSVYEPEDILVEMQAIQLLPRRPKAHIKRPQSEELKKRFSRRRQMVEVSFSCIKRLLPRYMNVRTDKGFYIKLLSTILAYSFCCLSKK